MISNSEQRTQQNHAPPESNYNYTMVSGTKQYTGNTHDVDILISYEMDEFRISSTLIFSGQWLGKVPIRTRSRRDISNNATFVAYAHHVSAKNRLWKLSHRRCVILLVAKTSVNIMHVVLSWDCIPSQIGTDSWLSKYSSSTWYVHLTQT